MNRYSMDYLEILKIIEAMNKVGLAATPEYVAGHISSLQEGYTYTTPKAVFIMGWLACRTSTPRETDD